MLDRHINLCKQALDIFSAVARTLHSRLSNECWEVLLKIALGKSQLHTFWLDVATCQGVLSWYRSLYVYVYALPLDYRVQYSYSFHLVSTRVLRMRAEEDKHVHIFACSTHTQASLINCWRAPPWSPRWAISWSPNCYACCLTCGWGARPPIQSYGGSLPSSDVDGCIERWDTCIYLCVCVCKKALPIPAVFVRMHALLVELSPRMDSHPRVPQYVYRVCLLCTIVVSGTMAHHLPSPH